MDPQFEKRKEKLTLDELQLVVECKSQGNSNPAANGNPLSELEGTLKRSKEQLEQEYRNLKSKLRTQSDSEVTFNDMMEYIKRQKQKESDHNGPNRARSETPASLASRCKRRGSTSGKRPSDNGHDRIASTSCIKKRPRTNNPVSEVMQAPAQTSLFTGSNGNGSRGVGLTTNYASAVGQEDNTDEERARVVSNQETAINERLGLNLEEVCTFLAKFEDNEEELAHYLEENVTKIDGMYLHPACASILLSLMEKSSEADFIAKFLFQKELFRGKAKLENSSEQTEDKRVQGMLTISPVRLIIAVAYIFKKQEDTGHLSSLLESALADKDSYQLIPGLLASCRKKVNAASKDQPVSDVYARMQSPASSTASEDSNYGCSIQ